MTLTRIKGLPDTLIPELNQVLLPEIDAAILAGAAPLTGNISFSGASTVDVTFDTLQADTNYDIYLTRYVNEDFWVDPLTMTTSGFTITSSNSTSEAFMGWLLIRRTVLPVPPSTYWVTEEGDFMVTEEGDRLIF